MRGLVMTMAVLALLIIAPATTTRAQNPAPPRRGDASGGISPSLAPVGRGQATGQIAPAVVPDSRFTPYPLVARVAGFTPNAPIVVEGQFLPPNRDMRILFFSPSGTFLDAIFDLRTSSAGMVRGFIGSNIFPAGTLFVRVIDSDGTLLGTTTFQNEYHGQIDRNVYLDGSYQILTRNPINGTMYNFPRGDYVVSLNGADGFTIVTQVVHADVVQDGSTVAHFSFPNGLPTPVVFTVTVGPIGSPTLQGFVRGRVV